MQILKHTVIPSQIEQHHERLQSSEPLFITESWGQLTMNMIYRDKTASETMHFSHCLAPLAL